MPVTAIVGAQYGSEGKGAVVAALAHEFDVAIRTGGPNAGHTIWYKGEIYKMRQIPCAWINPDCVLIMGAGAVIDEDLLHEEETRVQRTAWIDSHAARVLPEDKHWEETQGIGRSIGSTVEGVGAARIAKIARMGRTGRVFGEAGVDTVRMVDDALLHGAHVLLEGTQGSGLSLHHGPWPYVTSNDTNVSQLYADAGIPPTRHGHTLLVARTYPIRVGGHSGPLHAEMDEDAYERVFSVKPERTTVTNKVRRIGEWDDELIERAVRLNNPCGIILTFMDYIAPRIRGAKVLHEAWVPEVAAFVDSIEHRFHVPVVMIGVGGERFNVLPVGECHHHKAWLPLHPVLEAIK